MDSVATTSASEQKSILSRANTAIEQGFSTVERHATDAYNAVEAHLPEPVQKAANYLSQNPTRMTGFLFFIGDALMGVSGYFAKNKNGEGGRNNLKMLSSAMGMANSAIWMNSDNPAELNRLDRVIAKLDGVLETIAVKENGDVQIGLQGPLAIADRVIEYNTHDPVRFGGNLNAVGSVPMMMSGLRRGNVGEFFNGMLSIVNYGLLNFAGVKETAEDARKADANIDGARSYIERSVKKVTDLPSKISGMMDTLTSAAGFVGGLQDLVQNRVPKKSGILQMAGSAVYFFGGWFMMRMSGYQNELMDAKTVTADKPEDAKKVFDHTLEKLQSKGLISDAPEKNAKLLDTVADYMAHLPQMRLDAKDVNALRSSNAQLNHDLIRAGLQASLEASQQR